MSPATLRVINIFLFSEANLEVRYILHYERGGMSDNHFTHAVLCVKVQLIHKHEHYKDTIKTPRGTTDV